MSEGYKKEVSKVKPEEAEIEKPDGKEEVESPEPTDKEKPQETASSLEGFQDEFKRFKEEGKENPEARESNLRNLGRKIEDRSRSLESNSQGEKGQIDAVRARLGMGETGAEHSTHTGRSSQAEKQGLETLRGEIEQELRSGKEGQESLERVGRLRKNVGEAADALRTFASEIEQRGKNGFDPLFDAQAFGTLRSGYNALRGIAEGKGTLPPEELARALGQVNSGLERMGQQRQGGPVRDSSESLSRLAGRAQQLNESLTSMGRNFAEGDEQSSAATRKLSETSERVRVFAGRLNSVIRNGR